MKYFTKAIAKYKYIYVKELEHWRIYLPPKGIFQVVIALCYLPKYLGLGLL